MGSSASVHVNNKHERQNMELHRSNLMRGVEKFVINVYASFPRNESMRIILSTDLAREAFQSFVKAERAEESYSLYWAVSELRSKLPSPLQLSKEIDRIVTQYIRTETDMQVMISFGLQESCIAALSADPFEEGYTESIYQLCGELQEEAIMLMARDQFNRFLLSKQYKVWRATESSHAIATTAEDASLPSVPLNKCEQTESQKLRRDRQRKVTDLSIRAFSNIDTEELGKILGSENWLAALLAAVEGLPVSFCLATARKDRRGFPLMYVNKYFERMTGFSRSDVLGKNCRFLQCAETERTEIQYLAESLKIGRPATVILKNRTLKGKPFTNLVSLKPIYDDKDKYCYVIAIQIDVTREKDNYDSKVRLAAELMEMLPSIVMTDEEEEPKKASGKWSLFRKQVSGTKH
jgi:PAS domain S-box-containing protein